MELIYFGFVEPMNPSTYPPLIYVGLADMMEQIPLGLIDALNAEISLGTVQ